MLWKDREISRYAHPTPEEMEAHGFTDGRKVPGIKLSEVGFNLPPRFRTSPPRISSPQSARLVPMLAGCRQHTPPRRQ